MTAGPLLAPSSRTRTVTELGPLVCPSREPITTPTPTIMTTAAAIGTKQPIGSNATTCADSSNSGTPSPLTPLVA